jgi:hypothetical protein
MQRHQKIKEKVAHQFKKQALQLQLKDIVKPGGNVAHKRSG